MSFFRDQLERDIHSVFLNRDEFGEEIEIDRIVRKAVIDDSQGGFSTASKNDFSNPSGIGLVENGRVLYVKDDFELRPVPGQVLNINGEEWLVDDDPASVKIEMGLLVLRISRPWS